MIRDPIRRSEVPPWSRRKIPVSLPCGSGFEAAERVSFGLCSSIQPADNWRRRAALDPGYRVALDPGYRVAIYLRHVRLRTKFTGEPAAGRKVMGGLWCHATSSA